MIKQHEINKICIKPVIAHGNEPDKDRIKGYEYIPLLFANIFLCAKKKSGKTNVIYNLIENLTGPETEVYLFSSTLTKDPTYTSLMKMLKKKNITYEGHTSFINSKTGSNYLDEILHDRGSDDEDEGDDDEGDEDELEKFTKQNVTRKGRGPPAHHLRGVKPPKDKDLPPHERKKKGKKKLTKHVRIEKGAEKKTKGLLSANAKPSVRNPLHPSLFGSRPLAPQAGVKKGPRFDFSATGALKISAGEAADFDDEKDYAKPQKAHGTGKSTISPDKIFVFDDLGADLRHPCISQLLKTNRHERCKVILSSQYLTDLQPQAIKQIDFCMLFKAFGDDKLERIHQLFDLSLPWLQFYDLYKVATSAPFSFLYVDVRKEQFRKNFNTSLEIKGKQTSEDASDEDEDSDDESIEPKKRKTA
jgi:hypothetical protein